MSFPKPTSRRYDSSRNRWDNNNRWGNKRYDNRGHGYSR
jgi:hypothetical protein